jgi:hypothetical protein
MAILTASNRFWQICSPTRSSTLAETAKFFSPYDLRTIERSFVSKMTAMECPPICFRVFSISSLKVTKNPTVVAAASESD